MFNVKAKWPIFLELTGGKLRNFRFANVIVTGQGMSEWNSWLETNKFKWSYLERYVTDLFGVF